MRWKIQRKSTGSKGFGRGARGLARCGGREGAGVASPSSSDCNRHGVRGEAGAAGSSACDCNVVGKVGTWNVRSLHIAGKMANVMSEMKRMGVGIMGVAETCWEDVGTFPTQLPIEEGGNKFRVYYSGGKKNRRGVGVIMKEEVEKSVMMWEPISERLMLIRLKMAPVNALILQIYAPCEDDKEEEKDRFYESLDQAIKEYRKGRECLVVMGDFNGKVGSEREENTIGPFGLGARNDNGQRVVDFCKRHNLFVTNTWFQQKKSAQHTWVSPDGKTKNQIDYILVDKRFRNGILNSKSMPGADCESDHNPVTMKMKIRLQKVKKSKKQAKWNVSKLRTPEIRKEFSKQLDKQLTENVDENMKIDEIWQKLSEGIELVAEKICGKQQMPMKQSWMNSDILRKMEERRKCKGNKDEELYKKLKKEIRKMCRQAKDKYYDDKCKEIELLDKVHSQLLYQKINDLRPKGNRNNQTIKNKQGKSLLEREEVLERWAEYVEDLYKDENREDKDMGDLVHEVYTISSDEIESVIKDLPKGKTCGEDSIAAELLQCMGEKGLEIMVKLINKIYKSGYIPEDFRKSIFIPIPKVARAQECSDYRTIALISHASKVLLHLIKRRITPIIESQLGESQMGFRKGKGTKDAIFQLRLINERIQQMDVVKKKDNKNVTKAKKLFLCFVDYQKAFDRVKHDKLTEVMEKAGLPELERRLIINLYWKQNAAVRWEGESSRDIKVERGVRQGCVISPLLFNLYSEFMIREALKDVEGIISELDGIKVEAGGVVKMRRKGIQKSKGGVKNLKVDTERIEEEEVDPLDIYNDMVGINIGGVNITDLRYADDAVLVADKRRKMQRMLDRLNASCKEYGMEINIKKTKVMIMNAKGRIKTTLKLDGVDLERVTRFKYLGSWITDDSRCEVDLRARVELARVAFWQNKELMRRNIRFKTKLKILNTYVFSILNYGCECWTWNTAMHRKVDAFEMWCYRRMARISWRDRVSNVEVLRRFQTKLHFREDMMKRKLNYAGHVLRGSSGLTHLQILEGRIEGKKKRGAPRRTWLKDICEWVSWNKENNFSEKEGTYGMIKRIAEKRNRWKLITVNLCDHGEDN